MKQFKVAVDPEVEVRLRLLCGLILRWNSVINLVSRRDEAELWDRHVLDSVQVARLVPDNVDRAIDLGSGAGLPGLVLAICTEIPFDLVESDQRKAAFLREAARVTAAPAVVHAARAETLRLRPAPLVTARALAPLDALLALALPFVAEGGLCLFPKGRTAEAELTQAAVQWQMRVVRHPSLTDPEAVILQVSEIAHVGSRS